MSVCTRATAIRLDMSIRIVDFSAAAAERILAYSSVAASAVSLGHGDRRSHVYAIHVEAGGEIGRHPAGFDQLFLVVRGSGWVAGSDGVRHPLAELQGAFIPTGEQHAKGSETGMVAIMVQSGSFDREPAAMPPEAPVLGN